MKLISGLFCLILVGCSGFPYTGFIEEQVELYKKTYPKTFKTLKAGSRDVSYVYQENSQSPYLVVFIHGSPGSWESFAHLMKDETLLKKYALIAVDRPGFGTFGDRGSEVSLVEQAKLMNKIIEKHKKQKKVILIGHSYGGPLIARMAMDYTQNYEGLIFVAAAVDPELEKMK